MIRIVPTVDWRLGDDPGEPLDARLLPLLEAIAATASLAAAVIQCGVSYRAAWGVLREYGRVLGVPLVRLERGRGASLTAHGAQLLQAHAAARERLARILPTLAIDVGPATPNTRQVQRLTVAASHDLALTVLANSLPNTAALALDLSVMGSLNALREFGEERADVAGFHVPIGAHAGWDRAPFLEWLVPRRDTLIRFVDRDQGLILARGNPGRVRSLRGVVERKLRFVNRQRGSGTRLLVDHLLAEARIAPSELEGFDNEEFTHPAVAATVASGGADAGFGLRAAAAEYGLAFVPLVRERYFLAVRAKDASKSPLTRLAEALQSPAFVRRVRRLPGYSPEGAGSLVEVETLAPASQSRRRLR